MNFQQRKAMVPIGAALILELGLALWMISRPRTPAITLAPEKYNVENLIDAAFLPHTTAEAFAKRLDPSAERSGEGENTYWKFRLDVGPFEGGEIRLEEYRKYSELRVRFISRDPKARLFDLSRDRDVWQESPTRNPSGSRSAAMEFKVQPHSSPASCTTNLGDEGELQQTPIHDITCFIEISDIVPEE